MIESAKKDVSNEMYLTAGAGAIAGGLGGKVATDLRLSGLAKKTVKALNGSAEQFDTFKGKHAGLLSRAIESKKGLFGKINRGVAERGGIYSDKNINQAAMETLEGYWKKAAGGKLSHKYKGDKLVQEASKLRDKFLAKDILKSYKDVNKYKNIAVIAVSAAAGLFGACILSQVSKDTNLLDGLKSKLAGKKQNIEKQNNNKPLKAYDNKSETEQKKLDRTGKNSAAVGETTNKDGMAKSAKIGENLESSRLCTTQG